MSTFTVTLVVSCATVAAPMPVHDAGPTDLRHERQDFVKASACRECHQEFYEKWVTSWHGLAMRPFTPEFARKHLVPQVGDIDIGGRRYRVDLGSEPAVVQESGPGGDRSYPIKHVLGGKNVCYFLTPWRGGRWQVLPLAFDVRREQWYDMAASAVRHAPGHSGEAFDWTARQFTFNTSCYSCHVSQLSKNYSIETDTYHTVWSEPGINCDSCHGPGREHGQVMDVAIDRRPADMKIIRCGQFTASQINSMCGACHAKTRAISCSSSPGEEYCDNFDLTTLEDRDFYPDGRDLGENFTYTLWKISPCVASGKLDCMHCHTSSGRDKHPGRNADQACMPCHAKHVADPAAHSHHLAESPASRCVACHMPETSFARMRRHDHSMLPPTPAATIAFGSPNACNLCHADKDAVWADQWVRRWYPRDYQAPLMHRARLIDAARRRDWTALPDMLTYLTSPKRNEVYTTSLIRLLSDYTGVEKWPALRAAARDPSPLVRAAAVLGLSTCPEAGVRDLLASATRDSSRLVRVNAAFALSYHPADGLDARDRASVAHAAAEYEASARCAPDDPSSHYNLGIYRHNHGDLAGAVAAYETALKLQPDNVLTLVNISTVYARLRKPTKAERALRQALEFEPANAAVNFNLGLLLAEQGRVDSAERCLRATLRADPNFAEAAYNLGILIAGTRLDETIALCRKAAALRPDHTRYAYTLGFYLRQRDDLDAAAVVLRELLARVPNHVEAQALLATVELELERRKHAPGGDPK